MDIWAGILSCDWSRAGILSCDWLLQAAHPVLLLQPDRALPADRLHGGARLHAAARLGGKALPGYEIASPLCRLMNKSTVLELSKEHREISKAFSMLKDMKFGALVFKDPN